MEASYSDLCRRNSSPARHDSYASPNLLSSQMCNPFRMNGTKLTAIHLIYKRCTRHGSVVRIRWGRCRQPGRRGGRGVKSGGPGTPTPLLCVGGSTPALHTSFSRVTTQIIYVLSSIHLSDMIPHGLRGDRERLLPIGPKLFHTKNGLAAKRKAQARGMPRGTKQASVTANRQEVPRYERQSATKAAKLTGSCGRTVARAERRIKPDHSV